jgi:hypothetical protein
VSAKKIYGTETKVLSFFAETIEIYITRSDHPPEHDKLFTVPFLHLGFVFDLAGL